MKKLKVLDLFSGIGGFSLGLEKTGGFETIAFSEIDEFPKKTLQKNFPNVVNLGDVTKIDFSTVEADVICGGFPCTDISIASKTGDGIYGKRSGLWNEYFRAIGVIRPRYCIIENVFGLLGRGLEKVLHDLAQIGYDATWTVIDSQYTGVPQRRRRVYILGVRDGIPYNSDIFQLAERDRKECRSKVESFKQSIKWNFKESEGDRHTFAYFTRQRSNEFACAGVSSTLTKRDYKDFTDIVLQNGLLRRVTPLERLRLQGFPDDWFPNGSETEKFMYNGMTVPAVTWIGKRLLDYERQV